MPATKERAKLTRIINQNPPDPSPPPHRREASSISNSRALKLQNKGLDGSILLPVLCFTPSCLRNRNKQFLFLLIRNGAASAPSCCIFLAQTSSHQRPTAPSQLTVLNAGPGSARPKRQGSAEKTALGNHIHLGIIPRRRIGKGRQGEGHNEGGECHQCHVGGRT